MTPIEETIAPEKRTVASLSRLEKAWLRVRYCGFCDARLLGSSCYALSGMYELPVVAGVRDRPEMVDLGPGCDMDEKRAQALKSYRPRALLIPSEETPS